MLFASVGGPAYVCDLDGGRRQGSYVEQCDFLKVVQSLNILHQEGGGPFEALDLDARTRHLDLYYAADATAPSWTFLGTFDPPGGGAQTLSTTYVLPSGGLQAVRARFRYQGSAGACNTGSYDDHDDLVFAVNP